MRAAVLARRVPFRLAIILKARKPNVVAGLCLPLFQPPDVTGLCQRFVRFHPCPDIFRLSPVVHSGLVMTSFTEALFHNFRWQGDELHFHQ